MYSHFLENSLSGHAHNFSGLHWHALSWNPHHRQLPLLASSPTRACQGKQVVANHCFKPGFTGNQGELPFLSSIWFKKIHITTTYTVGHKSSRLHVPRKAVLLHTTQRPFPALPPSPLAPGYLWKFWTVQEEMSQANSPGSISSGNSQSNCLWTWELVEMLGKQQNPFPKLTCTET